MCDRCVGSTHCCSLKGRKTPKVNEKTGAKDGGEEEDERKGGEEAEAAAAHGRTKSRRKLVRSGSPGDKHATGMISAESAGEAATRFPLSACVRK